MREKSKPGKGPAVLNGQPTTRNSLLRQQRPKRWQQRFGQDLRAFCGGVNAVGLDGAGNVDEVFIDHGHKGYVVTESQSAIDLLERLDVVGAVVGRQRDAGEKNFNVGRLKRCEDLIEVVAGLVERKAAQPVVAAELDDDNVGMKRENCGKAFDGVFGGSATGAAIEDGVVVALGVEKLTKRVRDRIDRQRARNRR